MIKKVHHVAYRCADAKQTVEWYGKYLGMKFILAIAENTVPSTKEPDPYMHIFLDAGSGNVLAFFELPTKPPMKRVVDASTPSWTQHLALEVETMEEMLDIKARLESDGIEVIGPTDHTLFRSIYFFDPSGHRLEIAVNAAAAEHTRRLDEIKWLMLDEWAQTKRAPELAKFVHGGNQNGVEVAQ